MNAPPWTRLESTVNVLAASPGGLVRSHRALCARAGARCAVRFGRHVAAPDRRRVESAFDFEEVVLHHAPEAAGIRMAVVSDSWPNLEAMYEQLGLREFFDGFAISTILGCRKPDPRMYLAGSELVDLPAEDCVFVDDDAELVAAAIALGYQGLTICRDVERPADVPSIESVDELVGLIDID